MKEMGLYAYKFLTLNRTIQELKYIERKAINRAPAALNRTIQELKSGNQNEAVTFTMALNRTIQELK